MNVCGTLHGEGIGPQDENGCLLEMYHSGPHEFVDQDGQHWVWETDWECTCDHCMLCEGDYCTTYWRTQKLTK